MFYSTVEELSSYLLPTAWKITCSAYKRFVLSLFSLIATKITKSFSWKIEKSIFCHNTEKLSQFQYQVNEHSLATIYCKVVNLFFFIL